MYKKDLALNNQQRLISLKSNPNRQEKNLPSSRFGGSSKLQSRADSHADTHTHCYTQNYTTLSVDLRIHKQHPLQIGKNHRKRDALGMTLDYIRCWGSSFEDLDGIVYSSIEINPRSTLIRSGCTCQGPILGSNIFNVPAYWHNG